MRVNPLHIYLLLHINHFHHEMANLDAHVRTECLICKIFHFIESYTARSSDATRHQFMQKLLRAAARTPHAYRSFFTNKGEVSEEVAHALQLDRPRFDSRVDHLTRALFFKEYGSKWTQSIFVISLNIFL